jgi:hypothetical protein
MRHPRRACSDARVSHTSAERDRRFVVNRNDIRTTKEVMNNEIYARRGIRPPRAALVGGAGAIVTDNTDIVDSTRRAAE